MAQLVKPGCLGPELFPGLGVLPGPATVTAPGDLIRTGTDAGVQSDYGKERARERFTESESYPHRVCRFLVLLINRHSGTVKLWVRDGWRLHHT